MAQVTGRPQDTEPATMPAQALGPGQQPLAPEGGQARDEEEFEAPAFREALRQAERELARAAAAHRQEMRRIKIKTAELAARLSQLTAVGDSGELPEAGTAAPADFAAASDCRVGNDVTVAGTASVAAPPPPAPMAPPALEPPAPAVSPPPLVPPPPLAPQRQPSGPHTAPTSLSPVEEGEEADVQARPRAQTDEGFYDALQGEGAERFDQHPRSVKDRTCSSSSSDCEAFCDTKLVVPGVVPLTQGSHSWSASSAAPAQGGEDSPAAVPASKRRNSVLTVPMASTRSLRPPIVQRQAAKRISITLTEPPEEEEFKMQRCNSNGATSDNGSVSKMSHNSKNSRHTLMRHPTASSHREFSLLPGWDVDDDCLTNMEPVFCIESLVKPRLSTSSGSMGSAPSARKSLRFGRWARSGVLHPQSLPRLLFDVLALMFMVYDIVMIPVVISFNLSINAVTRAMDWATVLFWTADMALALNTGFYGGDGSLVMCRRKVICNYCRTWLSLDLLILVPEWYQLLRRSSAQADLVDSVGALKAVRFIRVLRLLRLVKLDKILRDMQARINSNLFLLALEILRMISCLSILIHFIACFWYGLGAKEDGWVAHTGLVDAPFSLKYLTAVHWSLTQFHGSMEVSPTNVQERLVAVLVLVVALILFSSFLSSITHMMMQLSSLRHERTLHLRALYCFLDDHHISSELSVRVKKYVECKHPEQQQKEHDVEFLKLLPKQLMMDLHEEVRAPILSENTFFFHIYCSHPRAVRQLCHDAVHPGNFHGEDIVFVNGDSGTRMFFVEYGSLRYHTGGRCNMSVSGSGQALGSRSRTLMARTRQFAQMAMRTDSSEINLRSVSPAPHHGFHSEEEQLADGRCKIVRTGRWLSEASLWTRWEHRGDLEATSHCSVLMIDSKEFRQVLENYEEAFTECVLYARVFVEALSVCAQPSDLLDFAVTRRNGFPHSPQRGW